MRKKSEILEIMEIFNQENPNPQCELNFNNAYTLLVAVVLSAQTTDKGVNRATSELFQIADTPEKMLALGEEKLKSYIRTIGLFNNKAKNIIALSRELIDRFNGEVPATREDLETLAGVGRKTANVVLNEKEVEFCPRLSEAETLEEKAALLDGTIFNSAADMINYINS